MRKDNLFSYTHPRPVVVVRTLRVLTLQVQEAYSFYRTYILEYSRNKAEIYEQYGFSLQGSVGSKDWEVFAAILVNDKARQGDGADLENYEVKSATTGSSFEYQYHRNRGLNKLTDDRDVDPQALHPDITLYTLGSPAIRVIQTTKLIS